MKNRFLEGIRWQKIVSIFQGFGLGITICISYVYIRLNALLPLFAPELGERDKIYELQDDIAILLYIGIFLMVFSSFMLFMVKYYKKYLLSNNR